MIARLLLDLRQRGVEFRFDGDSIRWRAPAGVICPDELAQLRAHRDEVFDILDRIEERCAIREIDGGQSRAEAEAMAWAELATLASSEWRGAA